MPKLTSLFAATTLIAGIIAVHLWQQLHDARKLVAQLQQERMVPPELRSPATLAIEPGVAGQSMPPSVAAGSTAPVIQPPPATSVAVPAGINQTVIRINQTAMRTLFPDLDKSWASIRRRPTRSYSC